MVFELVQRMKRPPGSSDVGNVPTEALSMHLIQKNEGHWCIDRVIEESLSISTTGGVVTLLLMKSDSKIQSLGLNPIDYPVNCNDHLKIFQEQMCR